MSWPRACCSDLCGKSGGLTGGEESSRQRWEKRYFQIHHKDQLHSPIVKNVYKQSEGSGAQASLYFDLEFILFRK